MCNVLRVSSQAFDIFSLGRNQSMFILFFPQFRALFYYECKVFLKLQPFESLLFYFSTECLVMFDGLPDFVLV